MTNLVLEHTYKTHPFTDEQKKQIFDLHYKVVFKKGDFFLNQGKISNGYMIVESGLMRAYVNDYERNEITTNFFSENEIVIEVSSLFQRIATRENIVAVIDCVC
jgi:CRP-like cAMP-binding protein